jgi:valyl-tRNA synthetase
MTFGEFDLFFLKNIDKSHERAGVNWGILAFRQALAACLWNPGFPELIRRIFRCEIRGFHVRWCPSMATFDELPKAYDASTVEDGIYQRWEESGAFQPHGDGEPYCIVMPPPNRTGTLHMGHATMLAIEDLLIRFERMRGKKTLWIPGTDHAAIATQVKVEQELIKQGMKDPRKELGREKFLEKVVEFAEKSATTIRNQVRKMGSSCDWTREKYTLDDERNHAVNEMFKMMFDDGIIERGFRIVNWDPQFQTTLSDDEVLTKEVKAKLLTFTYDKDFPIAISTTRPETKFGDTAVAVHPSDERYTQFVGQTFTPTFCGKKLTIKIIADEAVDPTFGTGALGVTPAHAMIDAEMAERHGVATIQVIGTDGKMLPEAGSEFAGLAIKDAREKIEQMLSASGVLKSVEEIAQNLPVAERGGAPVEQLPMKQWFIRVNKKFKLRQDTLGKWKKNEEVTLKQLMIHAVESGQTTIVPERFNKIYFHWVNNLRDWCISRQIWFGHRVPVWYKGEELQVSAASPGEGWTQDPDTLDTWFSSGLWTFSTLGWPDTFKDGEKLGELAAFHPTAVLETGYDILPFWVARMLLMTTYALGEVPFKDVYLHGLVRDEQGRKMSKSLGNILDPLDLIPKYGTDAVRLSLVIGTTPGMDMKLSEEKIAGFRNFTNKLWNISRFMMTQMEGGDPRKSEPKTLADAWIRSRWLETSASVTKKIAAYQFSSAGEELRDFTWGDVADWYLEIAKIEKGKQDILATLLEALLTHWHPFMPFVTEYIWKTAGFKGDLITTRWPEMHDVADIQKNASDVRAFELLRTLITDMRRLRSEQGIEPVKMVEFSLSAPADIQKLVEENLDVVKTLSRASSVSFGSVADGWATLVSGSATIGLNVAGSVDVAKERAKTEKEIEETQNYLASLEGKLKNQEFLSKAPAKVKEDMERKYGEAQAKLGALKERLGKLA